MLARATTIIKRRRGRKDEALGEIKTYLDERRNWLGGATFLYYLMPLPTNSLFIAAGLVEVSLVRVMIGSWVGRVFAGTFYVWTTDEAFLRSATYSSTTATTGRPSRYKR